MAIAQQYSAPNEAMAAERVPIEAIRPSPLNPRKHFDENALAELAESIKEHGLLEPLVVRPLDGQDSGSPNFELIAGERRWRACKMASVDRVPVRILVTPLDDNAVVKLMLVENLQRADLDPLEEAAGYRQLAQLGMKQREIAEGVHRSQPAVANAMRLLDLPEAVQEKLRAGELTATHGVALASYKVSSHVQEALAELAVKESWTTKKLESYFADAHTYYLPEELKPYVYDLRGGAFDWQAECRGRCPHDAFRASSQDWRAWCLRPLCYEEKRAAHKAAEEAAAEAQIREAQATGAEMVKLWTLPTDSYRQIFSRTELPPGCVPDCPKRVKALTRAGASTVEICSDSKCWRRLEMAETRQSNKAKRGRAQTMLVDLERAIDGLQSVGPREMAVIASLALSGFEYHGAALKDSLERLGMSRLESAIKGERWDASGKMVTWNRYDVLSDSECSLVDLARIILEVTIRRESQLLAENPKGASTPIADWWLDGNGASPAATEPPAKQASIKTPQTHRCASSPAECDRRCAWATGKDSDGYPACCHKFELVPIAEAETPTPEPPATHRPCGEPALYRVADDTGDEGAVLNLCPRHIQVLDPNRELEVDEAPEGATCEYPVPMGEPLCMCGHVLSSHSIGLTCVECHCMAFRPTAAAAQQQVITTTPITAAEVPLMRCGRPAVYRLEYAHDDGSCTYRAVCDNDAHIDILDREEAERTGEQVESVLGDPAPGDICEASAPQMCRVCGCTAEYACENEAGESCWWVEDDLCSACAEDTCPEESKGAPCGVCIPANCDEPCDQVTRQPGYTAETKPTQRCPDLAVAAVAYRATDGTAGTLFACFPHLGEVRERAQTLGELTAESRVLTEAEGKIGCCWEGVPA